MELKLIFVLCFNIGLIYSQSTKPVGTKTTAATRGTRPVVPEPTATVAATPQLDLGTLQRLLATFQSLQAATNTHATPSSNMPGLSNMPVPAPSTNRVVNAKSPYEPNLLNTNVPFNNNRQQQQNQFQNQISGQFSNQGQLGANVNLYRINNHISNFEKYYLNRSFNLDEEQKFKILEEHNKYRAEVSHMASAMNVLRWSEQLAAQADMEILNCSYVNQGRGASLAAVYEKYTGSSLVSEFMNRWSDEKNRFALGENCSIQRTCRYSQAIWAKTKEVGCAVKYCGDMSFIACSYSPVGNTVNQIAYQQRRGGICSECPAPRGMPIRCNTDHLCEWY